MARRAPSVARAARGGRQRARAAARRSASARPPTSSSAQNIARKGAAPGRRAAKRRARPAAAEGRAPRPRRVASAPPPRAKGARAETPRDGREAACVFAPAAHAAMGGRRLSRRLLRANGAPPEVRGGADEHEWLPSRAVLSAVTVCHARTLLKRGCRASLTRAASLVRRRSPHALHAA
ncbi:hypothetical protein FGB62_228g024 [Gracilaria domingensis]|nr:hypothetical protein FGB62_228g024 [Gracilaria domingensis]